MSSQLKILVPGETHVVELVGQRDELLKLIEESFASDILVRGNEITITGPHEDAEKVAVVFEELIALIRQGHPLTLDAVARAVQMVKSDGAERPSKVLGETILVTRGRSIKAKTAGQKRYIDAIQKNTVVFAVGPAGTGKCVAADTLVLTAGGMVEVGTLAGDGPADTYESVDLIVHGLDGPEPAGHAYRGGVTDTIVVTTKLGYAIETTPEHPLLALDAGGEPEWRRADELRVGDVVALQRGQRMFGTETRTDASTPFGAAKAIPREVLRAPEAVVAGFLNGLFETAGSVDGRGVVTLSSASATLVRQVQTVLLNFGIVASRTVERGRHVLMISGAEADRLDDCVGLARGRARLGARAQSSSEDVGLERGGLLLEARPSPHELLFLEVADLRASRAKVFDLTVPGTHSFVGNGFVNHNTYLAVAMAVKALKDKEIARIILTRPAVEAGERLGFLPGDIAQKVDPYLKPLYDALYEMLEPDHFARLTERGTIEVAPLAFMRGRAQPYWSRVLTPDGFRPIGSLDVGDLVIGSDGRPTPVLGTYPQGPKEVFRVTTQDGASTLCCAEHLWSVQTPEDRRRGKPPRIMETRDMLGRLRRGHVHRFELPLLSAPAEFVPRDLPIDPYALGLLLGDGCLTGSTTPAFATSDPELAAALEAALAGIEVRAKGGVDYVLRHVDGHRGGVIVANPVTAALRELGLCGTRSSTKFIPSPYLLNSPTVRLAVLQGLLDADGGPVSQVGSTCRIQYATTSDQLRDDVVFLVRSLGGVAYTRTRLAAGRRPGRARGRDVHYRSDAHVIDIRLPAALAPFRLPRKLDRYLRDGGGRPMRFVDRIEPAGEADTVCIRVGAADSLYVTDDFLVTHNTLNDSFIILDEAQNTSPEQMKMFLTRLGLSSKAVVTGDVTQIDLPEGQMSGLIVVEQILDGISGLEFVHLDAFDVVRHKIVQQIVEAYRRFDDARRMAKSR